MSRQFSRPIVPRGVHIMPSNEYKTSRNGSFSSDASPTIISSEVVPATSPDKEASPPFGNETSKLVGSSTTSSGSSAISCAYALLNNNELNETGSAEDSGIGSGSVSIGTSMGVCAGVSILVSDDCLLFSLLLFISSVVEVASPPLICSGIITPSGVTTARFISTCRVFFSIKSITNLTLVLRICVLGIG